MVDDRPLCGVRLCRRSACRTDTGSRTDPVDQTDPTGSAPERLRDPVDLPRRSDAGAGASRPTGVARPRALRRRRRNRGRLAGWLSLSTVWSTLHIDTATAVVALVATTCFGLYLAVSFSLLELVTLIVIGMQPGLLVSGWSIARRWAGSRDPIGNWVGIFFNRNSLGPPAVIASAGVLVLVAVLVKRRPPLWWAGVAVLVAVCAFDLRLQLHGDSATSWMVLAVFAGSWTLWQIAGVIARRVRDDRRTRSVWGFGIVYFCVVAVVTVTALVERNRVSAWLGRPPEFDGRGLHWSANWAGVKDRPFFGWGWLAAWHTPEFRVRLHPEIANDIWSHSAYFDLVLGGGVVAAVIFAAIVVVAFAGLAETRAACSTHRSVSGCARDSGPRR